MLDTFPSGKSRTSNRKDSKMLLAFMLITLAIVGPQFFKDFWKLKSELQHLKVTFYAVAAFMAYAYVAVWLTLGIPRGQYPAEGFGDNLWATAGAGLVLTFLALRANKVLKDMESRTTPAST